MKRLLAFALLIALGVIAMRFAIGDEAAVRADGPSDKTEPTATAPGVPVSQGNFGATVSHSGVLDFTDWRELPIGEGRVRKVPVYRLSAPDSRPVGEGLQELLDVKLRLYEDGVEAITVSASRAFVTLGRGANGEPTIDRDKTVDLRDCVVTAEPGSKLAGLVLSLGDARVDVGEEVLQLSTDRDQPVSLTMAGERPITMTGKGAQARLPRSRGTGLRRADVEILSEPLLVTEDVRISAKGRLHYVEDTVTGAAQVSLQDDVSLELARTQLTLPGLTTLPGADDRSSVHGDQFNGWLLRDQGDSGDLASARGAPRWQRMTLLGAPATVEVPGLRVETPRLSLLSGPAGEPFVVTAHGGESHIRQTGVLTDRLEQAPVTGSSPRRIHMLQPGAAIGADLRSLGVPRWALRPLDQQQVVVFEGASRMVSGDLTLEAVDGFRVVRSNQEAAGIVRGFGAVTVHQVGHPAVDGKPEVPELLAHGSDGLTLIADGQGQRLFVGPRGGEGAPGWRAHRYDVRYGDARLAGVGACIVDRRDGVTTLELQAPFDEIQADLSGLGTTLRRVHTLSCRLGEQLEALDVTGLPALATMQQAGEHLLVQASHLVQIGPRSLRLEPMPADVAPWSEIAAIERSPRVLRRWRDTDEQDQTVEVIGPRIDVHHSGGQSVIVEALAIAGELPRVYARLPQRGAEATTVTCAAERLRILPFVLTPETRRFYLGGANGPLADAVHHAIAQPWLLVDQVHEFALDDARQGHVEGTGDRLFVAQGGGAALFVGDAEGPTPAIVTRRLQDRTVTMQGARVRVFQDEAVRLVALGAFDDRSMFLRPTMTLHTAGSSGLLAHMRSECGGNIQVDPDAVRFDGPVEVQGITPEGELDPEGVFIDAERLQMNRRNGEVVAVAGRNVRFDWTSMKARAAQLDLDLLRGTCVARDPDGAAVDLADGRSLRSRRIEVDYRTWAYSMASGRATQRRPVLQEPEQQPVPQEGDR
ncbi:MAG: hypothetical protein R3F29_05470 [Planctomycetota bacterium]